MSVLTTYLPGMAVAATLFAIERTARAPRTDVWINLLAWALNIAGAASIYAVVRAWDGPALIDGSRLPTWAAILVFLVVYDIGEYLFHRMQHRVPVLWAMHSLHHSDPEMCALTTSRHYWADPLFKTITVWSASAMIISPTPAVLAAYSLISLWHFFVHSRLEVNFGRWSWLINTPAYHRRHHSRLPEHYDSNFAALLPIWDVLLGSYHRPDGFPPTGLDTRPHNLRELIAWPLYHARGATARD